MEYPNNLRQVRKNLKVRCTELIKILNITPQHYYALERGEKQLNITKAKLLAEALNVSINRIVSDSEESTDYKKQFGKWLQNELDIRRLRPTDFYRISGIKESTISRTLRGIQLPMPSTLKIYATVLKLPLEELYNQAGYGIVDMDKDNEDEIRILALYRQLSDTNKKLLHKITLAMIG